MNEMNELKCGTENRKRCILKSEFNMGAQIFFFDHPKTDFPEFDKENVRIFLKKDDERPFLRCHISKIIEVPENVKRECVREREYPCNRWFFTIVNEWR